MEQSGHPNTASTLFRKYYHELDDGIIFTAKQQEEDIRKAREKVDQLQDENPILGDLFENSGDSFTVSSEQRNIIQHYVASVLYMQELERKYVYEQGHKDCLFYLKNMGIL